VELKEVKLTAMPGASVQPAPSPITSKNIFGSVFPETTRAQITIQANRRPALEIRNPGSAPSEHRIGFANFSSIRNK
jgi:hypothetical protein